MTVNNEPFLVDFNSSDEDHAVWLPIPCCTLDYKEINYTPHEGDMLWVSDGELQFQGKVLKRIDRWVVLPNKDGYMPLKEKK